MDKISVIIPVYNDNVYIKRCLNSLINQTYKNLEIIVVDDGSTDNTFDILKEFAKKDTRIIVISQENQKLGAARNAGYEASTGNYISFIDSDDWVDLNYFEKMLSAIKETNADLAISSARRIKANGKFKHYMYYDKQETFEGLYDILKATKHPPYNAVWGKLYARDLIGDLRFEVGVFYEDINYTIRILQKTKRLVTVPNVMYNYFNNSNSIMKSKPSIQKSQNIIDAWVNFYNFIEANDIKILKEFPIEKERHAFWSVKRYRDFSEYYIFGIKAFTKKIAYPRQKTFLVFNTACLGDVLVCDSLCQNIKAIYPDSKLIFVVDKPCRDVAINMAGVDDVIVYDKKGVNAGILGFFKFLRDFKYKNVFATFITYRNERSTLISKFIGAKYTFQPYKWSEPISTQEKHNNSLSQLTFKKVINYPIHYNVNADLMKVVNNKFSLPDKYIVLSPISKKLCKDMPIETVKELTEILITAGYKVILTGIGDKADAYATKLVASGSSVINLVNKTSILELACVIKQATGLITVDTGTLHLGCALGAPTLAVFYETETLVNWAPNPSLYKSRVISKDCIPENIYKTLLELIS